MIKLRYLLLATFFIAPTLVLALDEIIPGKHQILKDTKVIIQENKFNQVKLFMKNGVFEFTSIEYDKKIPSYRFNKDPIEIETYEIVFFDANDKQIYKANIGNPFLVKAQHIGFEDSDYFYGYDNQGSFNVPYPKNIEPKSIVIYKVFLGTRDKLQKVLIN